MVVQIILIVNIQIIILILFNIIIVVPNAGIFWYRKKVSMELLLDVIIIQDVITHNNVFNLKILHKIPYNIIM